MFSENPLPDWREVTVTDVTTKYGAVWRILAPTGRFHAISIDPSIRGHVQYCPALAVESLPFREVVFCSTLTAYNHGHLESIWTRLFFRVGAISPTLLAVAAFVAP